METTPRAVAISMEHLETSVHQTTAFSSDEGVAASPPTTPIDCSDTTLFPFHCRVSPSVGSSYGPSPPASNLPADSSLVQSCSVKKDQHNSEKVHFTMFACVSMQLSIHFFYFVARVCESSQKYIVYNSAAAS